MCVFLQIEQHVPLFHTKINISVAFSLDFMARRDDAFNYPRSGMGFPIDHHYRLRFTRKGNDMRCDEVAADFKWSLIDKMCFQVPQSVHRSINLNPL